MFEKQPSCTLCHGGGRRPCLERAQQGLQMLTPRLDEGRVWKWNGGSVNTLFSVMICSFFPLSIKDLTVLPLKNHKHL